MAATSQNNLLNLFQEQVEKKPSSIAVVFKDKHLTYGELDELSNQLAHLLIGYGVKQEILVAICLERSLELLVTILGVLKAGGAYIPLDPMYPQERIGFMLEDSEARILVTSTALRQQNRADVQTILFDEINDTIAQQSKRLPNVNIRGNYLAYTLYTSGSTGKPKGVQIEHRNLLNFLESMQAEPGINEKDTLLALTTISFDIAGLELLLPLVSGAKIILADDAVRIDGYRILDIILSENVTVLQATPATWRLLLDAGWRTRLPLKALCGGEAFPLELAKQLLELCDEVWNVYGPTETTIWSTLKKLEKDRFPITIGHPIKDTQVYVLDKYLNPVQPGEVGELFIGGAGVARGYLKRPDLNAEKFIDDPFASIHGARMYRTGDLGKFLPDGGLQCLGRIDNQVKIQGFRIELGEIENTISLFPSIKQNCVHIWEEPHAGKRLAAYLVVQKDHKIALDELTNFLKNELPDYMVPTAFVQLDSLPLTNNGKVDRKMLPKPVRERPQTGPLYKAPATPTEKHIISCWKTLLGMDKIGVDDNFFELGGNSLLATKTVALLKEAYGIIIPVIRLYQHPTASRIAQKFEGEKQKSRQPKPKKNNSHQKMGGDVAIIGMAGRFPGAKTVEELWQILLKGQETIKFFSDEEMDSSLTSETLNDPNYVKARGIIDDVDHFDATVFGLNPVLAKLMDPQQRIFLEICRDVLEQNGCLGSKDERLIGVYAGTGNNTYYINNVQHQPEEIAKVGEFQTMLANEKDYTATRVAYQLDLKGPAMGINTACSASLVAVIQAVDSIRRGQCELAIAGGISINVPVNIGQRFEEGAMFSIDGHTRPFDAQATGTVFSDGAGVVLLKNLDSAQIDGDTIYAVIKGVGMSNDGGGKGSFMAPSAEGQAQAIRTAIDDANVNPDDIGYIEAHGTATPLGDPIEVEGLKLAFGETEEKQYCRIGSIKSNLGHLTHAAGVAGLIKTALALYHGTLPPSINFEAPNPNIDFSESPFMVNNELFDLPLEKPFIAGVSSFGVGGTNAHVILSSHVADLPVPSQSIKSESPALITWSAKTGLAGAGYAKKLADYLEGNPNTALESVVYTLQHTREKLNFRYATVVQDRTQAIEQLRSGHYLHDELQEHKENLVFLFPGQGAQYPGMGSDLYRREPIYRDAIDECADILSNVIGEDIRQLIFPAQALSPEHTAKVLKNTRYTQPAIFITSYALAKLWISWGIQPTAFIGHSVGEFVAATLSGIFSLRDALKLIAVRGNLSASIPPGSMLSIRAPEEEIRSILHEGLSIAAHNAPQLCVVAGPDEQVAAFSRILEEKGIACKPLHTSHAFHSEMMRSILKPFEEVVAGVTRSIPKLPIISTVTGSWLTDKQAIDPAYWTNHMIATVRFSDSIRFAEQELDGPIYLEAGPGQVTTTLTKQHGTGPSKRALFSIQAVNSDECLSTRQALVQMWMRGIEPNWRALYTQVPAVSQTLPTYAYDKKQYWVFPKNHIVKHQNSNQQIFNTTMRRDNLIAQVRSILEDASGIDISEASSSANFIELGLDSLLLTQVAQNLKKAFNVPITFRMLNEECNTLDALGLYLDAHLPQQEVYVTTPAPSPLQPQAVTTVTMPVVQQTNTYNLDAIGLISQQISLISQQIALLQGATPLAPLSRNGTQSAAPLVKLDGKETTKEPTDRTVRLTAEEEAEIKKPFGATARIEKQSTALSEPQSSYLLDFISQYVAKTAKSKSYTQQYRDCMADPRVVSGFRPTTKEIVYSIVANKSKGCRLWDLDGNEYIDVLNGFGSNFLGYQPEVIKRALIQQIEEGYEIGPQHEKAGEVCKLVTDLTGMDRVGLCNTGSEAVLGAMRIARTVTGRSIIVAFANSYHGITDEVIVRGSKKLKTYPAASGIMPEAVQNMLILDYGTEESLQIIKDRAHELAAILVEPVQSRRPEFLPVAFLKELRKISSESGSALIFDEVISGFRFHPAGIQGLLDIQADIATYGKVAGAGISIGIIAGKSQFMNALDGGFWKYGDDSIPEAGVTYFAGTFVRHPLALATTKAALEYLKEQGPQLQETVGKRTKGLVDKLNSICERYQTPLYIAHFGSLWKVKSHIEYPYSELLFAVLRLKGIHIQDGFPCYMTTAHTEEDISIIIKAFEESIVELINSKFMPGTTTFATGESTPPLSNARLGKDQQGNPAWFVEDENNPGKYLQVAI